MIFGKSQSSWPGVGTLPHFSLLFPRWTRRPTEVELERMGYQVRPVGRTAASAFMFSEDDVCASFPRNHYLFRSMLRLDPAKRPSAWQLLLRC